MDIPPPREKMAKLDDFFSARADTPKPKKGTETEARKVPKGHQKKWLTPFGVRIIDEAHRAPTPELPHELLEDFYQLECEDGPEYCDSLLGLEMRALVDDSTIQLQRVFIYGNGKGSDLIDCYMLRNLHKHPCEEIHVRHASCSKKSAEYISSCASLKVINFLNCEIDQNDIKTLIEKLPNLEVCRTEGLTTFEMSTKIAKTKTFACHHEPKGKKLQPYLDYISSNSESIEFADIRRCGKPILKALTDCPNLKSFSFRDRGEYEDSDAFLKPFLSSTAVQKRLEHIDLHRCYINDPTYKLLGKFTNIKWLNLYYNEISTEDLLRIIENNSEHIVDVDVGTNSSIGDGVLDAVAKCKKLNRIDLRETGVTSVAVNLYKSEKRPNHEAILQKMYGDVRHHYYEDDPWYEY